MMNEGIGGGKRMRGFMLAMGIILLTFNVIFFSSMLSVVELLAGALIALPIGFGIVGLIILVLVKFRGWKIVEEDGGYILLSPTEYRSYRKVKGRRK